MDNVGTFESRCPLCGVGEVPILFSLPLEGFPNDADYRRCANCDLVFLDCAFRLTPAQEKARYELHENRVEDPGYRAFLEPAVNAIRERLPAGASGLDFGAGPGPAAAAMLREAGYSVRLYDPYFHPDSSALEARYDFVLTTEAAEHFAAPAAEFARLRGILLEGGILVVMTTLLTPEIDFSRWYYRRDPTHVVFYSETTVRWIAAANRLSVDEIALPRLFVLRVPSARESQKS